MAEKKSPMLESFPLGAFEMIADSNDAGILERRPVVHVHPKPDLGECPTSTNGGRESQSAAVEGENQAAVGAIGLMSIM